jgi:hypothetical protein
MHAQTKIHRNKTMKQHVRKKHNTDKYQLRSTSHAQNWRLKQDTQDLTGKKTTTDIHVTENKSRETHEKHWYSLNIYIKYMVTVLQYKTYLGEGKKMS